MWSRKKRGQRGGRKIQKKKKSETRWLAERGENQKKRGNQP